MNRYGVLANGYAGEFWVEEVLHEGGEYIHYSDHIKIVDQQLAEIDSLKAELTKLMSSLEQWDEVFK